MRLIEPPGGGEPCVAFSARQFGMTRERLDAAWESGEPIDPADANRWVIRKRVVRDDGSGEYFVSNRFGGRAAILIHAPRAAAPPPPAPPEPATIERSETGVTAKFLEGLFRGSLATSKPAYYHDDLVEVEGDSRPPGGRVSWFLRRRSDGAKLIVRLDLPAEAPAPPLPPPPAPPIDPPTPARPMGLHDVWANYRDPAPAAPKARKKKGRDQQASFGFADDDDGPSHGPYRHWA